MSVLLAWDRIASLALRPVVANSTQEGGLGAVDLQVPRLGDKFAVDVTTSQLRLDAQSRSVIASLTEGLTLDVRLPLRLPNRSGAIGDGVVDGSGQAGSTIAVRGLAPGQGLTRGDALSLVHSGVRYVHLITAPFTADGSGKATIALWPMLRFVTVDSEPVELNDPIIEGRLSGFDAKGASFSRNRTDPLQFSITERR